MKKQHSQLLFLILAALWGAFIFYLSSIPDLASSLPPSYDFVLRKLAHIAVFLILAYFVAASLASHKSGYLLFVALAIAFYAIIDEVHQSFIPGRVGSAVDIIIDSIGIFLGIWIYHHVLPKKLFKKWR